MDVLYDYETIKKQISRESLAGNREYSMWRYLPFLPVERSSRRPHLRVGWTPLYRPEHLMAELGIKELWLKDEGLNPTASLKDRPSAVAVARAVEEGFSTVACSSTGNAASSLAGSAAAMGLKSVIFVPARAPQGKVAQLLIFGAQVVSVQGDYQDAFRLSAQAIDEWGWYNRNAAINPYLVEGKKTVTLEICEQMGWQVPDWAFFSVGDGCTIAAAWKGYKDLFQAGFIDRLPRMAGVQAEGCCPISRAFFSGQPVEPMAEDTIADSIAVGMPRNPIKALQAITESGGTMVNVSDGEILAMMKTLGHNCGVFGEPAGVTGLAGLKKLLDQGVVHPDQRVVACVSGNGLKDVQNAIRAAGEPLRCPPDMADLRRQLAGLV